MANKTSAREIKFRAWDNIDGCMIDWTTMRQEALNRGEASLMYDVFVNRFERLSLMQYTGLKDVNEKEIYEGDIIRIDECVDRGDGSYDDGLVVVYFKDGKYCVDGDTWADLSDWGIDFHVVGDFTVVGNIHENKELLEGFNYDPH